MDREVIEELITLRLQGYGSKEMDSEIELRNGTRRGFGNGLGDKFGKDLEGIDQV